MPIWTGIALARLAPGQDGMESRLSTYLHPLAGRPLAWHTLAALASHGPANLVLSSGADLSPEPFAEAGSPLHHQIVDAPIGEEVLVGETAILADAAAPLLEPVLAELLEAGESAYVTAPDGRVGAAHLTAREARRMLESGEELSNLPRVLPGLSMLPSRTESTVVTDRSALAFVGRIVRDRIVHRLMAGGTTFLLPDTVLVDADVRIGRDSVVYPGVIIEGETTIGDETVIGPGCRIVDSWVGSGVEMKGWNFISRTSIRNRAILEPHVRRGFD